MTTTSTMFRFKHTYSVYAPQIIQVGGNDAVKYVKFSDGIGMLTSVVGNATGIVTDNPIPIGWVVRNVKDTNGNLVFKVNGSTYDMYVHSSEPQLNAYGTLIGWKHSLRNQPPRTALTAVGNG